MCAIWPQNITLGGQGYPVHAFLNGLQLPLQGTLYHDVVWTLRSPLHALRGAATTKQAGFPVIDENELWNRKEAQQVVYLIGNAPLLQQTMFNLVLRGCNPFICGAGRKTVAYEDLPSCVTLECLKGITVTPPAGPAGNWNVAMLTQFDNWCLAAAPLLAPLFSIRIANHPVRANFFGQPQHIEPAETLLQAPLWNLFDIFTLRNNLQDNACSDLTIRIWLHIGEMLAAWRTGTIGLRQMYLRLRKIWDFCDEILESLKMSKLPGNAMRARDGTWMDAIHDLVVSVLETKQWVTRARQRLNGFMRQSLFGLPSCVVGDRWDVEDWKDSVEGPLVKSYEDPAPIAAGQAALEAHCALALKGSGVLKNTFQTIYRYIKTEGEDGDADYWDAHGFPWDQKLLIETGTTGELIGSILEKLGKHLHLKDKKPAPNVGIVLDATCCSQQFYERVWDELYEQFNATFVFWRPADHFPLFIDAVSTTVLSACCAAERRGLSGVLFQFHRQVNLATISFVDLTTYCQERCKKVLMDAINPGDSWDWHRDRKLTLSHKGVYFEYGIKYAKLQDTQMRLLIDWRRQRLYCAPLHYSPYVVVNRGGVVRHTGLIEVTGVPAAFWQKF